METVTSPPPDETRLRRNETDRQAELSEKRTCNVFIAGDSVTSVHSRKKMSNKDIQVKIKSHSGGRFRDISNTLIKMAEEDADYICNLDAILIHCGTNNLSDGESTESVTKQFKQQALLRALTLFVK